EPIGDLKLEFAGHDAVSNYRRELDLDTAITKVSYTAGGAHFTREFFASPVDQLIVVSLTADRPRQISFAASFTTPQKATTETEMNPEVGFPPASSGTLIVRGENGEASGVKGALKFQARARVIATGGRIVAENGAMVVSNANSALILIAAATSYKSYKD